MLENIFSNEEFEDLKRKLTKHIEKLPILYQKKLFQIMAKVADMLDPEDHKLNAVMLLTIALAALEHADDQEKEKVSIND